MGERQSLGGWRKLPTKNILGDMEPVNLYKLWQTEVGLAGKSCLNYSKKGHEMIEINLHELTIDQMVDLRKQIDNYISTWFGFSPRFKDLQTPEFIEQAKWRLEGQFEPCCDCGENYPRVDLHFGGEIYCPECRQTENRKSK